MYAACSGWSPVVAQEATASAPTAATIPASDQRRRRENSEATGSAAPARRPADTAGPAVGDRFQGHGAAARRRSDRPVVRQQLRPALPAVLRALRSGRVARGRREQRQGAQSRVGHLSPARRRAFDRAQQQPVRLHDLAGAG